MTAVEQDEHEPAPLGTYCADCNAPVIVDGETVIDLRTNEVHQCRA